MDKAKKLFFLCAAEFIIYYCQWADPISRGLSFSDAFKTRIKLAVDTVDKYSFHMIFLKAG